MISQSRYRTKRDRGEAKATRGRQLKKLSSTERRRGTIIYRYIDIHCGSGHELKWSRINKTKIIILYDTF